MRIQVITLSLIINDRDIKNLAITIGISIFESAMEEFLVVRCILLDAPAISFSSSKLAIVVFG